MRFVVRNGQLHYKLLKKNKVRNFSSYKWQYHNYSAFQILIKAPLTFT